MASLSIIENATDVDVRVRVDAPYIRSSEFKANRNSYTTAAPPEIQKNASIFVADKLSKSSPWSLPTDLQLELLRACEENASQPMIIMCENEDSNPMENVAVINAVVCVDDDEDETTPVHINNNYMNQAHHARPIITLGAPTIPNTTTTTAHQPLIPAIGPLPFVNPGLMIRVVESRRPVDVLIGKSQTSKMHVGNVAFRAFVNSRLDLYQRCTRRGYRIGVCVAITNAVFAAGGRFYVPLDKKCRSWKEASIETARDQGGEFDSRFAQEIRIGDEYGGCSQIFGIDIVFGYC